MADASRLRDNRDFMRLWGAATVSAFGTDITHTALPFVAVLTLDATAWDLGLLGFASVAPSFASGLFAGAWVDRVARRPLMIACDWTRLVLVLSIPAAAWFGLLSMVQLGVVAGGLAIASALFDIADRSMLPSLVGRDELASANRLLTAGNTVAEATGFAASGWLVQLFSAPGALLIDGATYAWSALMLRRIQRPEAAVVRDRASERIGREIGEGLRFVRRDPVLFGLASSLLLMSGSMRIIGTVYLLYVNQVLGFSPGVLGLIFATGGLFSLAASLTGGRLIRLFGVGPILIGSLVWVGAGQSLIAFAGTATAAAVAIMLLQQAMDLPWTLYEVNSVTVRQAVTPDAWQGRMNGSFHVVEYGGYIVGALLGGWIGETFGLRTAIVVGAVGIVSAAAPLLISPVRALRAFPAGQRPS